MPGTLCAAWRSALTMNSYRVMASLVLTGSGRKVTENLAVNLADGMDPLQASEAQLVDLGYTDAEITAATFKTVPVPNLA